MALNKAAFITNYVDETKENIRRVSDGTVKLKKDPDNQEELNTVLRALHTIKGSSRMLKFINMESISHASENIFKGFKEQRYSLSNQLMQLIFVGNDLLINGLQQIQQSGEDTFDTEYFSNACEKAYGNEPFEEDLERLQRERNARNSSAAASEGENAESPSSSSPVETGALSPKTTDDAQAPAANQSAPSKSTPAASEYETIRVKLSSVHQIIESLNTVIIRQFQFKQIQDVLSQLEASCSEYIVNSRKLISSGSNHKNRADAQSLIQDGQNMLKSIQNLRKGFVDQIAGLEQNSFRLQERIMELSMLPLDLILGELPRMVAETAAMIDKDIDFSTSGSDILMDKMILENLNDPILHIVRNAVDHGIESPEDRKAVGKPETGTLTVSCSSESGNIIIRIRDDGRGIDHEQIKRRAVQRGLISENDVDDLTESEIISFIFVPGFSTKTSVTELSGRGVGLDIVKHNIEKVKGKITASSTPGEGSEFMLSVPLSLATVAGFFVKAGGSKFLIPSNFVQKIVRLHESERVTYYNKEGFKLDGQIVPIYSLAALLGKQPDNKSSYIYAVVVESMSERIGIVVDSVLQHASLIYKPVPHNIQKLRLIQGIVFDESYQIINILFVPELMNRFKRIKSIDLLGGVMAKEKESALILVVDDSLNTREIEKSILELEGYSVVTADDGIEGLERMKEQHFDLIISDIDMPRMDGITMIENIRKDRMYKNTPIIVVTSYTDPKTLAKMRQAGADRHLVKSDFDRNSLIEITEDLLARNKAVQV